MYALIMRRWGGLDTHAYFIAFSSDETVLSILGKINKLQRGGKYEGSVEKLNFVSSELYATKGGNEEGLIKIERSYFPNSMKYEMFRIKDSDTDDLLTAHHHYSCFNTEEQVLLRDWYCSYLKSIT